MGSIEEKAKWPGWETVGLLGRGGFGAVFEIQRDVLGKTEYAALKVLQIPQNENDVEELYASGYNDESVTAYYKNYLKDIVREYQLMLDMKGHTNVVYCDDFHYEPNESGIGWTIYIKMELLTPLLKSLGTEIEEETVIRLGRDIANALVLCRSRNILHRDIKPQNIFISRDGDYKLGDFGIAKTVERTVGGTKIGTYNYMAPEVYNNKPYGHQADIYSLGLVMYWMLNERRMPFVALPPAAPTASMQEEARNRRFRGEAIPAPRHGSAELQRIVLKACAAQPKERYQRAEDLRDDLERLLNGDQGEVTAETDEEDGDVTVLDESTVFAQRDELVPEEEEKTVKKEKERTSGRDEEKKSEEKKEENKKEKTRRKSPWGIIAAALGILGLAAGAWYMRDRLPIRAPEPSPEATVEIEPTPEAVIAEAPVETPTAHQYEKDDIIQFGRFAGMNSKSGEVEPIEWRVLDADGDRLFVLCETSITDEVAYGDEEDFYRRWSDSYARIWLNGEFYDSAFTPEEQAMIQESALTDPSVDNLSFYVPALGRELSLADNTTDRVFLLSKTEYEKYFGASCSYLKCGYVENSGRRYITVLRSWLLRTMGTYPGLGGQCTVTCEDIGSAGEQYSILNEHGNANKSAICPAMWIQIPADWDGFVRHEEGVKLYSVDVPRSAPLEAGSYPVSEWNDWTKNHCMMTSWGGVYIDGNGYLWQFDNESLTARRLSIARAECFAHNISTFRPSILLRDGSVMVLEYDEQEKTLSERTTLTFPQRIVSLFAYTDELYAVSKEGNVYYYNTWSGDSKPTLIEGLPAMDYVQAVCSDISADVDIDTHSYLGKGKDGSFYVWGLNSFSRRFLNSYDAVLTEPVKLEAFEGYYYVYLLDGRFAALDKNRRLEIYNSMGNLEVTLDNVAYLLPTADSSSGDVSFAITTKGEVYTQSYVMERFSFDYGGQEPMHFEEADGGWYMARYLPSPIKEVNGTYYYAFRLNDGRVIIEHGNTSGFLRDAKGQEIYFT